MLEIISRTNELDRFYKKQQRQKPNSNILLIFLFSSHFPAHFPPFYSPLNDRMRKRRAFADQDLMDTTLTNYYLQMSPPTSSYPVVNYNDIANQAKLPKTEIETPTRPKISFSIESIIGLK